MKRLLVMVVTWLVGAVACGTLAWSAVHSLARDVLDRSQPVLSAEDVRQRLEVPVAAIPTTTTEQVSTIVTTVASTDTEPVVTPAPVTTGGTVSTRGWTRPRTVGTAVTSPPDVESGSPAPIPGGPGPSSATTDTESVAVTTRAVATTAAPTTRRSSGSSTSRVSSTVATVATTTTATPTTTTVAPTTTTTRPRTPEIVTGGTVWITCVGSDQISYSGGFANVGYRLVVLDAGPDQVLVQFIKNLRIEQVKIECSYPHVSVSDVTTSGTGAAN